MKAFSLGAAAIAWLTVLGCSSPDPGVGSISDQGAHPILVGTVPAIAATGDAGGKPAPPPPADAGARAPSASDAGPPGEGGACERPNMLCGGVCVATTQDANNCGACGNACAGPGAVCIGGQCGCSKAGFDYCAGGGCMDVTSDVNNCGACGMVCDPNQFTACESGSCM